MEEKGWTAETTLRNVFTSMGWSNESVEKALRDYNDLQNNEQQ